MAFTCGKGRGESKKKGALTKKSNGDRRGEAHKESSIIDIEKGMKEKMKLRFPSARGFGNRAAGARGGQLIGAGRNDTRGRRLRSKEERGLFRMDSGREFIILLGGDALEGPRHIWWNFVSSSRERIEQAKQDWKTGRFAPVPQEHEFIPLPE